LEAEPTILVASITVLPLLLLAALSSVPPPAQQVERLSLSSLF
jgi:hypothetical protein